MKKLLIVTLVLIATAFLPLSASAQLTAKPLPSDAPYGYYEYLPLGYNESAPQKWPLVLFLHGAGERGINGNPLSDVLSTGLPRNINTGTHYPFVMIAPQHTDNNYNWSTTRLDELIEYAKIEYDIDPDRIYVTGLSMGGRGTWFYSKAHPEKLAAVLPICGADSGYDGSKLINVPAWIFHNWGDTEVTAAWSVGWANAIASAISGQSSNVMANYPGTVTGPPGPGNNTDKTRTASFNAVTKAWTWNDNVVQVAGSHPTLTLYPGTSHGGWSNTYNNSTVWKWLLAQTRYNGTNKAPAVTITAPANNATTSSSVTIAAQVADSDGTLDPVAFYAGSTLLGTDSAPPYQFVWNNAPAGAHWITVKATDNDSSTSAALVKINVPVSTGQIITPAAAGKADGSLYFPMGNAFDGQPTGLDASGAPTGGVNGYDAPSYSSRVGYIDLGPNWQKVRIESTWTKYRVSSVGNQTPYVELWWDDDIDTVNDSGLTETRVNFNTAQSLSTGSTEPWLRDRDLSASPVTPRARYLLCLSPSVMSNRAKEYAIVGSIVP
ncbi:MAG TPA: Ig-like domain-containing protein [Thermoanaerobaculia bacterium]|nr:Ig-like domain-containing protein [Thermoanaerobaculia bacterium]